MKTRIMFECLEARTLLSASPSPENGKSEIEQHDGVMSVMGRSPAWPSTQESPEVRMGPFLEAPAPPLSKQPLGSLPKLHSFAAAAQKLYLDFDGEIVQGTNWNQEYRGGKAIHAVPFDRDGDLTTFSDRELEEIDLIWQRVSEDFRPFQIDVTTEFPGVEALNAPRRAIRAIITTNVDEASLGGKGDVWLPDAGGVGYIGSWTDNSDTPVWVFYNRLPGGKEQPIAEATTHEFGHAFGLSHDGAIDKDGENYRDYFSGYGTGETSWGPIMGASYDRNLTQWSKGDYGGASNQELDLQVITSDVNEILFREDDHGSFDDEATPVAQQGAAIFAQGVIEERRDTDMFSLQHPGGPVFIHVSPAKVGPNLDILVEVFDGSGKRLQTLDPEETLSVTIDANWKSGTYYVSIDGTGFFGNVSDPNDDGYNDYGSLGSYTISGRLGVVPPTVVSTQPGIADIVTLWNSLAITFDQDVSSSLDVLDLHVIQKNNSTRASMSGAKLAWNAATLTATWSWTDTILDRGTYVARIFATDVTNGQGIQLDGNRDGSAGGDWEIEITSTIAADFNGDLSVDFNDFLLLSSQFGKTGTRGQGDANGDHEVNFADFLVLSQAFGT